MLIPYLYPLKKIFDTHANASEAFRAAAYMKGNHVYFGIKTTLRRNLIKSFYAQYGLPDAADLDAVVLNAYQQPQREFHLFGLELLFQQKKQWNKNKIDLFEKLIVQNSWWDSVDFIAVKCVGYFAQKFPEQAASKIALWSESSNM